MSYFTPNRCLKHYLLKKKKLNVKIAFVILAAGESARMGSIKQLLPWKDTTLLEHVINQGVASNVASVFVVLGANYDRIIDTITNSKITVIKNRNWSSGMGSSIACAIDYIKKNNLYFDAILIALADQPLIEFKYFNKLVNRFVDTDKNIVATLTKNKPGVPSIFGKEYFKILSELKNDIGAREIINSHINDVYIEKAGGLNIDIDTKDTYKILYNKYGKSI